MTSINKTVAAENPAGPLDGSELVRIVQGGNSARTTAQAIANLADPVATTTGFTPTSNVTSTNVQAAIVEVDTNSRTRDTAITTLLADGSQASHGAGAIGFQSGIAYVAGTVGYRLKQIINLGDAPYATMEFGAAVVAATAVLVTTGGILAIPPGAYTATTQPKMDVSSCLRSINVSAYGAEIFTGTSGISGFQIYGNADPETVSVHGLKINHRGNSTATAGIELVGTAHVTLRDCVVEAHGVSSSYAAYWLHQIDPTNNNTGCFWTVFESCTIRKRSGSDPGDITYGYKLQGAANSTTISNGSISTGTTGTGIYVIPEQGVGATLACANALLVFGPDIEGCAIGLWSNADVNNPMTGARMLGVRAEAVTTLISLTGATAQPAAPLQVSILYPISSVTNLINNPNNLYVNLDVRSITPHYGQSLNVNYQGFKYQGIDNTVEVMTIQTGNAGHGIALMNAAGVALGTWHAGGSPNGSVLAGNVGASLPLALAGIGGLSSTATAARNLSGSGQFSSSTTAAVTFSNAEADNNYKVFVISTTGSRPVGITAKSTTGFTVASSVSNSDTFDWFLVR